MAPKLSTLSRRDFVRLTAIGLGSLAGMGNNIPGCAKERIQIPKNY